MDITYALRISPEAQVFVGFDLFGVAGTKDDVRLMIGVEQKCISFLQVRQDTQSKKWRQAVLGNSWIPEIPR